MADPHLIRSALFADRGITALFTLRSGGISPAPYDSWNFGSNTADTPANIAQNFDRLCATTGIAPPHRITQVHGTEMHWFDGMGDEHAEQGDILLSHAPGTAIAVRTADCLPILLADPEAGIAAAGVVTRALDEMQRAGASAKRIIASLGPAIGPCCFEIGEDTARTLAECCSGAARHVHRQPTPHADLAAINRLQLLDFGIQPAHIEQLDGCTACDSARFFSWRRDKGETGRHLAVVALPFKT